MEIDIQIIYLGSVFSNIFHRLIKKVDVDCYYVCFAAASEQSSSKSATIEMYAPSSYNETVTGETLSSVSEKSESYSNGDSNQEYLEDTGTKPAASTYLIDQMEYPYPYPTYELQHPPPDQDPRNTYNHGVVDGKYKLFMKN
jgi:hypothetical protein